MNIKKSTIESEGIVQTEHVSYVRDVNTKALLSSDEAALNQHRRALELKRASLNEINSMKTEIEEIKTDVSEIKSLLYQLLDTK
jgi:hypothetical protein